MGSTLATWREEVAAAITTAGIPAYPSVPERVTPPAAIVLPDEPYVAEDEATYCPTLRVRLRVVILGGRGTNAEAANRLDELIATTVTALDPLSDGIGVAEPAEVELNGATYLGTVVNTSALIKVEVTP